MKAIRGEHDVQWVREFNSELQRVDHRLKLVWCPDPAPVEAVATGAQPGCWHIARDNQQANAPLSLIPLQWPDGTPRDPGAWVFDMLARTDLWNPNVRHERERRLRQLEQARERRENREREERRQELRERVNAIRETSISFNRDNPWHQNVAGRRGARR